MPSNAVPPRPAVSLQRGLIPLVACLATALAGCASSGSAPQAAVAPVAATVMTPLPQGSGCGPGIARTQAVVDSDVATGNLNQPVGARFSADLARASEACRAGRDREALGLLAAAKARYGYP